MLLIIFSRILFLSLFIYILPLNAAPNIKLLPKEQVITNSLPSPTTPFNPNDLSNCDTKLNDLHQSISSNQKKNAPLMDYSPVISQIVDTQKTFYATIDNNLLLLKQQLDYLQKGVLTLSSPQEIASEEKKFIQLQESTLFIPAQSLFMNLSKNMDKSFIFLFMTAKDLKNYSLIFSQLIKSHQQLILFTQENTSNCKKLINNQSVSNWIKERNKMASKWGKLNKSIINNGTKLEYLEKIILSELDHYQKNLKISSLEKMRRNIFFEGKSAFYALIAFIVSIPINIVLASVVYFKGGYKSLGTIFNQIHNGAIGLFIISFIAFCIEFAKFRKNNKARNKLILAYFNKIKDFPHIIPHKIATNK